MFLVVVALIVGVVYLASKPMPTTPQVGQALPPPPMVPGQGTTGVPSPQTLINPLYGTNAGKVALLSNARLPLSFLGSKSPRLPSPAVVTSVPLGPPAEVKQLQTQMGNPLPGMTVRPLSGTFLKL